MHLHDSDMEKPRLRHGFVDLGYESGKPYCRHLLDTGDFGGELLRKYAGGQGKRAELADALTDKIFDQAIDVKKLLFDFCMASRDWLSIRVGPHERSRFRRGKTDLFLKRKPSGKLWYGPFVGSEPFPRCYILPVVAKTWVKVADDAARVASIRWHIVAQVYEEFAAFHWNNVSWTEERLSAINGKKPSPFPYYRVLPNAMDQLEELIRATWQPWNLNKVLLHQAWPVHDVPANHWYHQKVRASQGNFAVHLNAAKKRTVAAVDISPIENLAKDIVSLNARILQNQDPTAKQQAHRETLTLLLSGLGTLSYGCQLTVKGAKPKALFGGHAYFGSLPNSDSEDCFPHLHCYGGDYGGSASALDFLRTYL